MADLVREYGPAVAGSIYLFLRAVYHLEEYFERTQFNYRTIPNMESYMDNVGSGRVTNLLFPGIENYINTMHVRVNPDLYNAFVNAAEAFSNPNFHRAISNMNPDHTARLYNVFSPLITNTHNAFEYALSIFPHFVSQGVRIDSPRTAAIGVSFTMLYYIGRAISPGFNNLVNRHLTLYPHIRVPNSEDLFNFSIPAVHLPHISSAEMLEILRNYELHRDHAVHAAQHQIDILLESTGRTLEELLHSGEELQRSGELNANMRTLLNQLLDELARYQADLDQSIRNRDAMIEVIANADIVPDDSNGTDESSSEEDNRERPN